MNTKKIEGEHFILHDIKKNRDQCSYTVSGVVHLYYDGKFFIIPVDDYEAEPERDENANN